MKFASIAALAASLAVADSQYLNLENKYYGNDNSTDTTTTESKSKLEQQANNAYMAKYIAEMLAVFMGELIYLNRLENIEDCVVNG